MIFLLSCMGSKEMIAEHVSAVLSQESSGDFDCFNVEKPTPFVVYSSPYDEEGNQSDWWHLQSQDGLLIDFEMGRATAGQVHLSSDGSWGAVAQTDGSIGVFRYLEGEVTVLDANLTLELSGESLYASELWLNSEAGVLWVTDQNWPENGGGLYRVVLDCDSGAVDRIEKVFSGKNAYSVRPIGDNWIFLSREIDSQPHQISIFDDSGQVLAQAQAFDDDDAIFSALASDGQNIFVGDNNEFSNQATRISHLKWDGLELDHQGVFAFEDPMSIVIMDEWALMASGYGDSIWQYHWPSNALETVMSLPLPSLVITEAGAGYAVGNTQIQKLSMTSSGFVSDAEVVSLSGVSGIIGAVGVFGDF